MSSRNVLELRSHHELFDGVVAYSANNLTLVVTTPLSASA
jgi:hypothetical protein